jgi:hypothetical protein
MPAWKHTNKWNHNYVNAYRQYVFTHTETKYRYGTEDCADLSMKALIDFAAPRGLPVTLENGFYAYSSSENEGRPTHVPAGRGGNPLWSNRASWNTVDGFYEAIKRHINVRDLWEYNTYKDPFGPQPGDLMIRYTTIFGFTNDHHAALVYRTYPPGAYHPKWKDHSVPDFPGGDKAMKEKEVTEYFLGNTVSHELGANTASRSPDSNTHFDYLNSRGSAKRNAELVYFANASDFQSYGFEFRNYRQLAVGFWNDDD